MPWCWDLCYLLMRDSAMILGHQLKQQQGDEPESTKEEEIFHFPAPVIPPLCSNSLQPIIFRPIISACWDCAPPPVFQGYPFFIFLFSSCASSDRSAANQLERLLLFLTRLCHSTHRARNISPDLHNQGTGRSFHRRGYSHLNLNFIWISLGQWEIAIVSLFIMVQKR